MLVWQMESDFNARITILDLVRTMFCPMSMVLRMKPTLCNRSRISVVKTNRENEKIDQSVFQFIQKYVIESRLLGESIEGQM